MQVALAQKRQKPPALYEMRGDIDLRLDTIYQRLVAKNPADRFSSGANVLHSLQQLHLVASIPNSQLLTSSTNSPLGKGIIRPLSDHATSISVSSSTFTVQMQPVAIDLGMLASTIAYCDPHGVPQIIQPAPGSGQHMRNMLWSDGEQIKVGSEATELRQSQPSRIFHCLQRWIGAKEVTRALGTRMATPEVLIAAVLQRLMTSAKSVIPDATHAVVTVPSCYDQMHRRAIQVACRIAGIELLQLLDKPLALALSWIDVQSRLSPKSLTDNFFMIVLHLGGTGLEASVIRCEGKVARLLGTCGDWQLGIPRWQSVLATHFSQQLLQLTGKQIREDVIAATRLQRTIELCIERLTRTAKVDMRFEWLGKSIDQSLTQAELLKLAPLLQESITKVIVGACKAAKIEVGEVREIILSGSMMRMRPLQEFVRQLVPQASLPTVFEKADVARGAAFQAQFLAALAPDSACPHAVASTTYDFGLLAIDPTSGRGIPKVLIERGSPLPATVSKNLRGETLAAGHTLQIIESTRLGDDTWHRLGAIKPSEAFPLRAPQEPLQLRMAIDDSGLLDAHLIWPAGNRQVSFRQSDDTISDSEIEKWKIWLETALLCSN